MEKERGSKVIAVVALVVAVVGLSIGFAGWTAQLTISDTQANIAANTSAGEEQFGSKLTVSGINCDDVDGQAAVTAVGTADGDTWSGTRVSLKGTGDAVTCTATVSNGSDYTAYLDDINITNSIACSGTGQNVQNACAALKLTVTGVGSKTDTATAQGTTITNANGITGNSIAAGANGSITMKVEYQGTAVADSDFVATIPTITYDYSTID